MIIMLLPIALIGFMLAIMIKYIKNALEGRVYEDGEGIVACIFFILLILLPGIIMPLGISYGSYLDIKSTYERVQNDYREAIEIYEDKAVIDVESITDFRYKGYQDNLGALIKDLRNITAEYNETFIKKQTMGNNIFFSWYIIEPDKDMKLLRLKE